MIGKPKGIADLAQTKQVSEILSVSLDAFRKLRES
jgi:hypothetical protein